MGREDFRSVSPFEKDTRDSAFHWMAFEDFKVIEEDGRLPYFRASSYKGAHIYDPLIDTPHLFLEFARIVEHKGYQLEALDNWVRKYGMLGLSSQNPEWVVEPPPEIDSSLNMDLGPEVIIATLRYSQAGGPGDTWYAYVRQAVKTNKLVTLYEDLHNQDIEGLARCFDWHASFTPQDLRE